MDTDAVSAAILGYIDTHRTQLAQVPVIQSQLLELGALVLSAEHYRLSGYKIQASNLINNRFKVKRTSGGWPWNFSWFTATRDSRAIEIHANLGVAGFYGEDRARYVLDVAVCEPGVIPASHKKDRDWAAENDALITFVEAKKLVIYPMLLAQFIGIVHEVKPIFLDGPSSDRFSVARHFDPALVTTGPWARSCERIYEAFPNRGFRLCVVPNLDVTLAGMRSGALSNSPFSLFVAPGQVNDDPQDHVGSATNSEVDLESGLDSGVHP